MIIAVAYDNGKVNQNFTQTNSFKLYYAADTVIVATEIVTTHSKGYSALANFLSNKRVDNLICGGIGFNAQDQLAKNEIKVYPACSGDSDEAAMLLLAGKLKYNPKYTTELENLNENSANDIILGVKVDNK